MIVEFEVLGPPKPWQRAGRTIGRTYTPTATKRYQEAIKTCAALACSKAGLAKAWPVDARYRVTIDAMFENARRRDLDNIGKSVLDALNWMLYRDDSQVDQLAINRHVDSGNPRTRVRVEVLPC